MTPLPPDPVAAKAAVTDWIVEHLRTAFPKQRVDAGTSFQALGLDSLVAFELMAALSDRLGRKVEPALLFEVDTADAVAAHVVADASRTKETP